jgi:hypothetical protein
MIDEAKIRERAYELWELAGSTEGDELVYWHQAREQLESEQQPPGANTLDSASGLGQTGIPGMPTQSET